MEYLSMQSMHNSMHNICIINLFACNWMAGEKDFKEICMFNVLFSNIDFTTMSPRTSVVGETDVLRFFCSFRTTCLSSFFKTHLLLLLHLFCFILWTEYWYTTAAHTRFSVIFSCVKGGSPGLFLSYKIKTRCQNFSQGVTYMGDM